jgi:hypothetical protein
MYGKWPATPHTNRLIRALSGVPGERDGQTCTADTLTGERTRLSWPPMGDTAPHAAHDLDGFGLVSLWSTGCDKLLEGCAHSVCIDTDPRGRSVHQNESHPLSQSTRS